MRSLHVRTWLCRFWSCRPSWARRVGVAATLPWERWTQRAETLPLSLVALPQWTFGGHRKHCGEATNGHGGPALDPPNGSGGCCGEPFQWARASCADPPMGTGGLRWTNGYGRRCGEPSNGYGRSALDPPMGTGGPALDPMGRVRCGEPSNGYGRYYCGPVRPSTMRTIPVPEVGLCPDGTASRLPAA